MNDAARGSSTAQTPPGLLPMRFDPIHKRVRRVAAYGALEVLHHGGVRIQGGERVTVGFVPAPQDEALSRDARHDPARSTTNAFGRRPSRLASSSSPNRRSLVSGFLADMTQYDAVRRYDT